MVAKTDVIDSRPRRDVVAEILVEVLAERGHLIATPSHILKAAFNGIILWTAIGDPQGAMNARLKREHSRMDLLLDQMPTGVMDLPLEHFRLSHELSPQGVVVWNYLASNNFDYESVMAMSADVVGLSVIRVNDMFGLEGPPVPRDREEQPSQPTMTGIEAVDRLMALVGLKETKKAVSNIVATEQVNRKRAELGLKPVPSSMHYVFSGSPGTGKTTVARFLGAILRDAGALSKGHLVEVGRSNLVGDFVGQTSNKTRETLEGAIGGVLFVDEAYSLADHGNGGYGQEALVEILAFMENNREDVCVVFAGYRDEMKDLIDTNPGLRSRFSTYVDFPDFSKEELEAIFSKMLDEHGLKADKKAMAAVRASIDASKTDGRGGNGRYVRNLFEHMYRNMAARAVLDGDITRSEVQSFEASDVPPDHSGDDERVAGFMPNEGRG